MAIILTSNGLTSKAVIDEYRKFYKRGFKRAAIIVTADPVYRLKNRKAVSTKVEFEKIGFETDLVDIEYLEVKELMKYQVIFISGGNPFYLLDQVRKTNTDEILRKMQAEGKLLSGSSAGSLVLGKTILMINEFNPEMNQEPKLKNLDGIRLTDKIICPHYTRYKDRYENFEQRICEVESKYDLEIIRINDGEALVIEEREVRKI